MTAHNKSDANKAAPTTPEARRPSAAPALAALSAASFAIGVGEFSPIGLLPEMANELKVDIPKAG